jgi:predicted regulator of Ras-like GTPase activity (Roadblock/LC7/MglB family)
VRFAQVDDLRRRGHHEAAERAALDALAEYPYDADGHYLLARIHAARGDAQRARDEWETALRLDPTHSGARAALASRPLPTEDKTLPCGIPVVDAPELLTTPPGAQHAVAPPGALRPTVGMPAMPAFADPRVLVALLTDGDGMVVAHQAVDGVTDPACEALGALLSGLARETDQVLAGLGLGAWRTLSVECTSGSFGLSPAPDDHVVILAVRAGTPTGLARRYLLTAQRHARTSLEVA